MAQARNFSAFDAHDCVRLGGMRWLKYFAWGIVLMLCAGAIFQAVASSHTLHHPPGALIDIGGRRMHLYCIGQGSRTVVLDAGLGDSWMSWTPVQSTIGQFARVCSYDRAGMGWSDSSPDARTSKVIAGELHTLLHQAGVSAPYVLVGHSFGGINVRAYADAYRSDVAGLVLVDSSHPDQDARMPPELKSFERRFLLLAHGIEYTMPFGLPRIAGFCQQGATAECSTAMVREILAEYDQLPQSFTQVRAAAPLGDLPIRVLSRDPSDVSGPVPPEIMHAANAVWTDLQKELAALSTNSKQTIATGCSHYIHRCKPELVVEAVRELAR